jgi:hypothetical protein
MNVTVFRAFHHDYIVVEHHTPTTETPVFYVYEVPPAAVPGATGSSAGSYRATASTFEAARRCVEELSEAGARSAAAAKEKRSRAGHFRDRPKRVSFRDVMAQAEERLRTAAHCEAAARRQSARGRKA